MIILGVSRIHAWLDVQAFEERLQNTQQDSYLTIIEPCFVPAGTFYTANGTTKDGELIILKTI